MGRYRVEAALEEGGESIKSTESNNVEHPIDDGNSPPIRRTDKGRIYGCLFTIDRGPRTKRIASKHLYPRNYTTLYMRMAYIVSTPRTTLL
jgi:hypothetical protein